MTEYERKLSEALARDPLWYEQPDRVDKLIAICQAGKLYKSSEVFEGDGADRSGSEV